MSRHELFSVWNNMLHRCYSPKCARYPRYGGRGITVCLRWHTAKNFIEDVGPRPSKDMQIDRIDNDGNYEPGNVRWATRKQNIRNRPVTYLVEFNGEMRPRKEISELLGINEGTLRYRILRGDKNPFRPTEEKYRSGARRAAMAAPATTLEPDWRALGYVEGATVEQDSGKSWAARSTITCVHGNGALDVEIDGTKYGWSAHTCKPVGAPATSKEKA